MVLYIYLFKRQVGLHIISTYSILQLHIYFYIVTSIPIIITDYSYLQANYRYNHWFLYTVYI